MPKLSYLSDEILYREVTHVLAVAKATVDLAENNIYKNVIDPFSAVFDSLRQGVTVSEWLEQEKARQVQKTMQNAVGDFHQAILGGVDGWEDLRVGRLADLRNSERRMVAEIKNKHNTTKGNHRKVIYDDLELLVTQHYPAYIGYYVEIIPKSKLAYNRPFTPPDNETGQRRPENEHIRIIDGRSFYALVTGVTNALDELYQVLPEVIGEVLKTDPSSVVQDPLYTDLFTKAYPIL